MARKVRRSRTRRIGPLGWTAIGCGSVLALALIGGGVILGLATSTPAPPPEARRAAGGPTRTDDAPQAQTSGAPPADPAPTVTAPPLEAQLQQVQAARHSTQPVQVRLEITEDALAGLLREHVGDDLQDPHIYFGDGTVVTTGLVRWQGQQFHVTVRSHATVANGDAELVVDEVLVGRMPAPAQLYADASVRLNRGLDKLLAREHLYIESIQVRPAVMVVTGRAGGRR